MTSKRLWSLTYIKLILKQMYNIVCCYVLIKIIKGQNHKYNISSTTFLTGNETEEELAATIYNRMNESEAGLKLIGKFILYKRIDHATALEIIEIADTSGYISIQGNKITKENNIQIGKEGFSLASGPLYAGIIREITKEWGIVLSLFVGLLTSAVAISLFKSLEPVMKALWTIIKP